MECSTKETQVNEAEGKIINLRHLLSYLRQVKDGRKRRGMRYRLEIILVIFILAKLCGQNKIYGIADWAQQQSEYLIGALGLKYKRLPHHSTYRRVLADEVEGEELERILGEYLSQLPRHGQDTVIAIDGKTVRGTITAEDPFGLHLLAAYLPGEGIVLMQMIVEKDKENEIVVAPKLLECLDLRNKVVIGDAMQTQRKLSIQIVAAEGDFVWIVKDNQKRTRQAIEFLFKPEKPRPGQGCPATDFQTAKTFDSNHGRLEERTIMLSSMLNDYLDWPSVQQVFKLDRHFVHSVTGKVHQETQYGITSLKADQANPEKMLELVRSEWAIENKLHFRRDVTFFEDKTRMTRKTIARSMAIINNLVIALFNNHGFSNHAQARRIFSAKPDSALSLAFRL